MNKLEFTPAEELWCPIRRFTWYERAWRFVRLFCVIVFKEFEPKSIGIPDPYRIQVRISPRQAWQVARVVWYDKPEAMP